MDLDLLATYRCPMCLTELEPTGTTTNDGGFKLTCSQNHHFSVVDGVPKLVYPEELAASDSEFQRKYDANSEIYDEGMDWLFGVFSEDRDQIRNRMTDLLDLQPGMRVLETGCGTGEDSLYIADRLGPTGSLYAQDLSAGMLQVARKKLSDVDSSVELAQTNASYLPFPDNTFDAAFHFGGINEFGDIERAIEEKTRVVRPGGKVVFGDEGIAPWLRDKTYGKILINANPLYRHTPPLDRLPECARDVRLHWLLGNAFYIIDFRVDNEPPPLNIDLPIPGTGDSLRSRYEARNT